MICYRTRMVEPSRRTSRLALAGGLVAAAALAGAGFMLGRNTSPRPEPIPAPAPLPAPPPIAAPIPVVAPLGRADLLAAAREAADAAAAGRAVSAEVLALDGRRFELRLPFGCSGPAAEGAPLGWRYDERGRTLRVRAAPVRWPATAWLPPLAAESVEVVEGFWIERPWTTAETCPPRFEAEPTPAPPPSPAPPLRAEPVAPNTTPVPAQTPLAPTPDQTLAVAQFHAADASRIGRRDGEAFEAVERIAPDQLHLSQGLRLRLTGRIAAAPGDGPVLCRAPAPDRRPVCLVSVSFDQVAIENPATGGTLATWDVSQRRSPEG